MNTERKQRILTKVAGLPRHLANIVKKVIAGRGYIPFPPSPYLPANQWLWKMQNNMIGRGLRPPGYPRDVPLRQQQFKPFHTGGALIPGTHGGKAKWRPVGDEIGVRPLGENYNNINLSRVNRERRLTQDRMGFVRPSRSPGFSRFNEQAKAAEQRAKAKRDAVKHTPWGRWGKFKTRDLRPRLIEREDWLGMRDPRPSWDRWE